MLSCLTSDTLVDVSGLRSGLVEGVARPSTSPEHMMLLLDCCMAKITSSTSETESKFRIMVGVRAVSKRACQGSAKRACQGSAAIVAQLQLDCITSAGGHHRLLTPGLQCCSDAPLPSIAQWVAGLFENIDLSPSDITAALILAAASQQQRRKMRIKRALAPKLDAMSSAASETTASEDSASETTTDDQDLSGEWPWLRLALVQLTSARSAAPRV